LLENLFVGLFFVFHKRKKTQERHGALSNLLKFVRKFEPMWWSLKMYQLEN
jgi:hypothetical protein